VSDSHSKGIYFEKFVAELFRKAGFIVEHNVVLAGRSGVKHQVDVLVSYRTPITTFRALVECKNWFKPVNKDVVMKVHNEVLDLGLDKGIIVTQSYATPEAATYAATVGVEIIDGVKLKELSSRLNVQITEGVEEEFIKYLVPSEECIKKYGSCSECRLFYYPIYEFVLERSEIVKKGIFRRKEYATSKKDVLFVDALHGCCVTFDKKHGLKFRRKLQLDVTDDEAKVYRYVAGVSMANVEQVASGLGMSTTKAKRILESLVGKELLKAVKVDRRRYYTTTSLGLEVYEEGKEVKKLYEEILRLTDKKPAEGTEVGARVPVNVIIKFVASLTNYKVISHRILYHPIIVIKGKDGIEFKDAYTCERFRYLNKVVDVIKP